MRIPQHPTSFDEILAERGGEVTAAHRDPRYTRFVTNCQRKYRHWDKIRLLARAEGLDPKVAWALIAMNRSWQMRGLPLYGQDGQPVRYMLPDVVHRHTSRIDQKLACGIDATGQPVTEAQRRRMITSALHEEAITSSMLEGAATTRRQAKAMFKTGRQPRDTGEQMVYNNHQAIEFIREHKNTLLTPDFLLELQAMLTRDTLKKGNEVGRFRQPGENIVVVDERAGEILHDPPPAEQLPTRLQQLCAFANEEDARSADDDDFLHPVIRAITLHFQVGYDHPFCDGNGRTARALFYWSMLRQGYAMFEYLPISRYIYKKPAAYQRAYLYTETDGLDLTYFLVYHLRVMSQATEDLDRHLRDQREKQRRLAHAARPDQISDRQWSALNDLRQGIVDQWTVKDYQRVQAVSYGSARNDLYDMEARGLLHKQKVSRQYVFRLRT